MRRESCVFHESIADSQNNQTFTLILTYVNNFYFFEREIEDIKLCKTNIR